MRYIWHHMPTTYKALTIFQTIIALTCWVTALITHDWNLAATALLITALIAQTAQIALYRALYKNEKEGADLHRDLQDRVVQDGAVLLEHIKLANQTDYIRATPITHDNAD